MLHSYVPAVVFLVLGTVVGVAFSWANGAIGPRRPNRVKGEPYESGLPSEVKSSFRFGISFYLIAMLFILFDIEVVFLYPIGVILKGADSLLVLGELITFVVLLLVAFVYVWRKGALDWR
jgi:NADH-quinone oxidoreductase subunit A